MASPSPSAAASAINGSKKPRPSTSAWLRAQVANTPASVVSATSVILFNNGAVGSIPSSARTHRLTASVVINAPEPSSPYSQPRPPTRTNVFPSNTHAREPVPARSITAPERSIDAAAASSKSGTIKCSAAGKCKFKAHFQASTTPGRLTFVIPATTMSG